MGQRKVLLCVDWEGACQSCSGAGIYAGDGRDFGIQDACLDSLSAVIRDAVVRCIAAL